jgi:hypothetical protein
MSGTLHITRLDIAGTASENLSGSGNQIGSHYLNKLEIIK